MSKLKDALMALDGKISENDFADVAVDLKNYFKKIAKDGGPGSGPQPGAEAAAYHDSKAIHHRGVSKSPKLNAKQSDLHDIAHESHLQAAEAHRGLADYGDPKNAPADKHYDAKKASKEAEEHSNTANKVYAPKPKV